jgi:glycosyltransferase involved in cell wall biosynthesis
MKSEQTVMDSVTEIGPRVSVIVPTLNEAKNLPAVFALMPDVFEVVLVDGRSTDDTIAVAQALRPDIRVVLQTRKGKGNALACGFAAARGDIIVMLDADGSADPREIPRFVRALVGGADFAKGTRFARGGGSSDITKVRRLGNKCLNALVNVTCRTSFTDLCYGYNAFWKHCLDAIDLIPGIDGDEARNGDGFEVETLINIRVAKASLKIEEVPSFEADRIHGVSNLNAVTDGLRVLRTIATERRRAEGVAPSELIGAGVPRLVDLRDPDVEIDVTDETPDLIIELTPPHRLDHAVSLVSVVDYEDDDDDDDDLEAVG